jgi:S1-C subfamily serine protease
MSTFFCRFASAVVVLFIAREAVAAPKVVTFKKPAAPTVNAATAPAATTTRPIPNAAVRNRIVPAATGPAYWLGLSVGPADSSLRSQLKLGDVGLVVHDVYAGTPAQAAGLKSNDVLLEIKAKDANTPLKLREDLIRVVNAVGPDAVPVQVKLLREGQEQTLSATPAKRAVR